MKNCKTLYFLVFIGVSVCFQVNAGSEQEISRSFEEIHSKSSINKEDKLGLYDERGASELEMIQKDPKDSLVKKNDCGELFIVVEDIANSPMLVVEPRAISIKILVFK